MPCAGSIYVEDLANSETTVGHGQHVAGIAAGNDVMSNGLYTGVAPEANLIGIGTGDILFIFWAWPASTTFSRTRRWPRPACTSSVLNVLDTTHDLALTLTIRAVFA